MEYAILALDLDGTLTNREKKITSRTKESIALARQQRVTVVLASGRPLLGILPLARELELLDNEGYLLANNGSQIYDCLQRECIVEHLLPLGVGCPVFEFARAWGLHAVVYDRLGVVAESAGDEYVRREAFNNGVSIREISHLESEFADVCLPKIMVVGEPKRAAEALPVLRELLEGSANVFLSEPYFIEIAPHGVDKATSMQWLLDFLQLNRKQMVFCGDGLNDLSMMRLAGMGVAMDNACDEVKDAASYITASNDDDGVAQAVEKLLLKEGVVQ